MREKSSRFYILLLVFLLTLLETGFCRESQSTAGNAWISASSRKGSKTGKKPSNSKSSSKALGKGGNKGGSSPPPKKGDTNPDQPPNIVDAGGKKGSESIDSLYDKVKPVLGPKEEDCPRGKTLKGGTYCYSHQRYDLAKIEQSAFSKCCKLCPESFEEGLSFLQISTKAKRSALKLFHKMHNAMKKDIESKRPLYVNRLGTTPEEVEAMLPCCAVCPTQFVKPDGFEDIPTVSFLEKSSERVVKLDNRMKKGGNSGGSSSKGGDNSGESSSKGGKKSGGGDNSDSSKKSTKSGGSSKSKSDAKVSDKEKKASSSKAKADAKSSKNKAKRSEKSDKAEAKSAAKASKKQAKADAKASKDKAKASKKQAKADSKASKEKSKASKKQAKANAKASKDKAKASKKASDKRSKASKKESKGSKKGSKGDKKKSKGGKKGSKGDKKRSKASKKASKGDKKKSKASKKASKANFFGFNRVIKEPTKHEKFPIPERAPEPPIPTRHFEIRSTYDPDKCCYVCDQKQLLNDDPGCCPVCPSLYKTITGGYEVFGGPFGPGVESNIAHQSNKVRPFVEKAGEELGLDPSTAVQETTVGEIGKSLFTKAKIDQAEAHNVMVDKHMKEETKRLKKLENKMREAHAFKLKLLNGVLDD